MSPEILDIILLVAFILYALLTILLLPILAGINYKNLRLGNDTEIRKIGIHGQIQKLIVSVNGN